MKNTNKKYREHTKHEETLSIVCVSVDVLIHKKFCRYMARKMQNNLHLNVPEKLKNLTEILDFFQKILQNFS